MAKKISVKGLNPVIHEIPRARHPVKRPGVFELPVEYRRPPVINELPPVIHELPPYESLTGTVKVLVAEIDSLRARLNNVENEILNLKLGRSPVGKPYELPTTTEE